MTFYKYSLDGKFEGSFTMPELFDLGFSGKDVSKIKKSSKGIKGYGFYDGFMWSTQPTTILNESQRLRSVNKWLTDNFQTFYKHKSERKEFDEDVLSDAVETLINDAVSPRGVNDYEYYLHFRYMSKFIDKKRKMQRDRKKVINDRQIQDSDQTGVGANRFGKNLMVVEEYGEVEYQQTLEERCVEEGNELLLLDLYIHKLHEFFSKHEINAWVMYHTHTKGNRKVYTSIVEKYGWSKSKARKTVRAVSSKITEVALDVNDTYECLKAVSIDDYTLNDF